MCDVPPTGGLSTGSLLVGVDGRIAEVNPSFLELSGWSAEALVGQPLMDVLTSDPVVTVRAGGPFRSLPALLEGPDGQQVRVAVRPFSFRLVHQGEAMWVVVAGPGRS